MKCLLPLLVAIALTGWSASAQSYPSGAAGPAKQQNLRPTDADEQYRLAYKLWIGKRIQRSEAASIAQLAAAARQGHVMAMHDFGTAAYWGLGGVKADREAGKTWILKACKAAKVEDVVAVLEEVEKPPAPAYSPFQLNTKFGRLVADAGRDAALKKVEQKTIR